MMGKRVHKKHIHSQNVVILVNCSFWKDIQNWIKIAIGLAVPWKPYTFLLASYTINEEKRLSLKFITMLLT